MQLLPPSPGDPDLLGGGPELYEIAWLDPKKLSDTIRDKIIARLIIVCFFFMIVLFVIHWPK